jgi:glycerol-3-phosphate dehydrogenase (NAD(P)+)
MVNNTEPMRIGVIGSGSWATALVKLFSNNQSNVNWWVRSEESIAHIQSFKHNPRYLQSAELEVSNLALSSSLHDVISLSDCLVVAVPAAFIHEVFKEIDPNLFKGKKVISAVKGIIPEFNAIPARYFHKSFGIPYSDIGIICGPCHAEEVALERLSYLTVGCDDIELAEEVARLLRCRYIKVTVSEDLFGAEISAILKNVYALASGICAGLGYGDNFQAVLVSNAIQEIERFIDVVNPVHRDVKNSAYLGDLLVTAYSKFSRNRTFGYMIGKGYSVKAATLEIGMIAEGYYATKSLMEMNEKFNVDLPILTAVYHIIYGNRSARKTMQELAEKLS